MFEHLAKCDVILVSGPPRSGTCLTAKCMAHDTGKEFVPEEAHGFDDLGRLRALLRATHASVIHAPSQSHHLHRIARDFPEVLIVFVLRDPVEIIASERRVHCRGLGRRRTARDLGDVMPEGAEPCMMRQSYWLVHQRHLIENKLEVRYEDLKAHPLWIEKSARTRFAKRQTKPGEVEDGKIRGCLTDA